MKDAVDWHSAIAKRFDAGYERSRSFIERQQVWSGLIAAHAKPNGTVLDAGCGSGVMSAVAAPLSRKVLAFDGSAEMLALACRRFARDRLPQVETAEARFGASAIAAQGPFDLVLCSSVLEYLDDLDASLGWLASLVSPGGTLLVSMPNGDSLYRCAERLVYRLTGRPAYRQHVRHLPRPAHFAARLASHSLHFEGLCFYGPAPLLSPLLRPLRLARHADTLCVFVCRRG